ncbi:MAG: ribbon-helix-helix domain-containing protein [Isosphaeraceae bacterium]
MEIQLPEDLERFVRDEVRAGHYASEEEIVRLALEQLQQARKPLPTDQPTSDPWLGSMREDAAMLDEIVEEAMKIREERPWRLPAGE